MRSILVILCFTLASEAAFSVSTPHPETISGRVIAYALISPVCLNGNGYWSVLIHVERPKNLNSQVIRVDFSLPCDKSPDWVSEKPDVKRFRLLRDKNADVALSGCLEEQCQSNQALPAWKRPPSENHDVIPFGQLLPSYRSLDVPMIPVV
jgi:hypothetical protein